MRLLIVIFSILIHQCIGERQLFCPNNGTPRPGIKCLPGQNDNNVCGEGYSCFFSGLNYHCCPSGDESADEHNGECPDYTFAVLDSAGKTVRCSTLGKECPGANTYCNENSPVPICCQNLKADNQQKPQEKQEVQAVEDFFNEESQQLTTSKEEKEECPKNSLIVLMEDGEPTYCNSGNDCPHSSMVCYGNGQKICCESVGTIGSSVEAKEQKTTTNIINIRPNSTQPIQTTTSQSTTNKIVQSTIIAQLAASTRKPAQNDKIGLSEATYKKSSDKIKEDKPKVFSSKTAVFDENAKPIKYKPHNSGGYAVSQTIKNDASPVDKKEIVQQYLLEQIKQGWPYDEKFYRPENTAVIQNGHRPSTVVHFP